MHKSLVLLSLILISITIKAQEKISFSIKGSVVNGDNSTVTLSYNEIGKYEIIDSSIVRHGGFEIRGKLAEAQTLNLKIGALSHPVFIGSDTEKIDINIDLDRKQWHIEDDENMLLSQMTHKPGAAFRQWTHALGQKEQAILQNDARTVENWETQAELAKERVKNDLKENSSFFNSLTGISVFYGFYKYLPLADKGELLNQFSAELHSSTYYKNMFTDYQRRARLAPGREAPLFSLVDTTGHTHNLTDYRGRYVLLDFGASWCYWCKKEEPFVLKAHQQHQGKLTVINISMDTKKDLWIKDLQQQQYPWISISDLQGWNSPTATDYYVQGVPRIILIDPQGKIIADNLRGEAMLKTIEDLLQ